jgi:putative glutamine amidotransferase
MPIANPPIVLIPACNRRLGDHPFLVVGRKYAEAVRLGGALPLVVPGAALQDLDALLDLAHGVLLTGSPSNVHPSHFGEPVRDPSLPLDPDRDALTLPMIRALRERCMPLMAICRGAQEVNVALGGSLHQAVHEVPGHADHRGGEGPPERVYGPRHAVQVLPGGLLASLVDAPSFQVNSVHGQGIQRLAEGLRVEARAPDGLVEAFTLEGVDFGLCVQWHPEWQPKTNPVSMQIFQAFGRAVHAYRDRARVPLPRENVSA